MPRRLAALLAATVVVGLLPASVAAAAPVAVDDPGWPCGDHSAFGGAFLIPEDWHGGTFGFEGWFVLTNSCDPLANDTDADGDDKTMVIDDDADHGATEILPGFGLGYDPDPDFSTPEGDWVSDTVVYHVSAGGQDSNEATIRLWVAPVNDPPTFVAGPDVSAMQGTSYAEAWATAISPGPSNEASQSVAFELVLAPGDDALFAELPQIGSDGTLSFTPAEGAGGIADVTVRAVDDGGLEDYGLSKQQIVLPDDTSDDATFRIAISANHAPVAVDDPGAACGDTSATGGSYLLPEDTETMLAFTGCVPIANDTDADADALHWVVEDEPAHGSIERFDDTGHEDWFAYHPDPDYGTLSGDEPGGTWVSDSFTYRACDAESCSDPATYRFWISELNDPPTFTPGDDVTVSEDSGAYSSAWAGDILAGPPVEVDRGQAVAFELWADQPTLFAAGPAIDPDGTLTFTPAADASGTTTVHVRAKDDGGTNTYGQGNETADDTSDDVTFTITITPLGEAPVAVDDAVAIDEDSGLTGIEVLDNDHDAEGDPFEVDAVGPADKGTSKVIQGGYMVAYTPHPDAYGDDSFTYTLTGGDSATVSVTITPSPDAPTADDDTLTVLEDATATAVPVLVGDVDVDDDPLRIDTVSNPPKGTATITGAGTGLTYRPDANAIGADSFTYRITDATGRTDTATVTVTITPRPDAPNAVNDTLTVAEGAAAVAVPVLANDTDADGDTLKITSRTHGSKGTVTITGGGTGLTYDPAALQNGSDAFTYTVSDSHGGTDTATVTVTIKPDVAPPTVTAPRERFVGQTLPTDAANTVTVGLTWTGADPGSGIASYQLQASVDGGAWTTVALPSPTTTSVDRTQTFGRAYRYRVRATDRRGNVSPYVTGPPLTPARLQESTSLATFAGTWSSVSGTSHSGGRARWASATTARTRLTVNGRDIALLVARSTGSGRVQVWVDGVLASTIDLGSTTTRYRQLIWARHWDVSGSHAVELRPVGDGRVYVDAWLVLR